MVYGYIVFARSRGATKRYFVALGGSRSRPLAVVLGFGTKPTLSGWMTSRWALRRALLVAASPRPMGCSRKLLDCTKCALPYLMAQMTYGLDGGRGGQRATRKKDAKSDWRERVVVREKRNRAQWELGGLALYCPKWGCPSLSAGRAWGSADCLELLECPAQCTLHRQTIG